MAPGAPQERDGLEALYRDAFPEEDLLPLVTALHQAPRLALAMAAYEPSEGGAGPGLLVGHALFTRCEAAGSAPLCLVGPLAVLSSRRRRGIGGALLQAGLRRMGEAGGAAALVLGDPAYYSRFGFERETRLAPPYDLPLEWAEAWRSRPLTQPATPLAAGRLQVPEPWRAQALWSP